MRSWSAPASSHTVHSVCYTQHLRSPAAVLLEGKKQEQIQLLAAQKGCLCMSGLDHHTAEEAGMACQTVSAAKTPDIQSRQHSLSTWGGVDETRLPTYWTG